MDKITVNYNNSPCYDIVFNTDFQKLSDYLPVFTGKICIVSDSTVAPLYLDEVFKVLSDGRKCFSYIFPAGEENKNLQTVNGLYEYLIQNKFERKDCLVALGGGVTGDLTGFCAATFLRGISFIQIPTTVLSMVDSSIGGKTGVDFKAYKNMVGAFHMPKLVYINLSVLKSLDERIYFSGFGEIIKHACIKDSEYFEYLCDHILDIKAKNTDILSEVIYRSCLIKAAVVEQDPLEKNVRAILNFGHTIGHAVEKLSDFSLYHGECVALGMLSALAISFKKGYISKEVMERTGMLIRELMLPEKVSGMDAGEILKITRLDKKNENQVIKFILLKGLGEAYISTEVTDDDLLAGISYILGV